MERRHSLHVEQATIEMTLRNRSQIVAINNNHYIFTSSSDETYTTKFIQTVLDVLIAYKQCTMWTVFNKQCRMQLISEQR